MSRFLGYFDSPVAHQQYALQFAALRYAEFLKRKLTGGTEQGVGMIVVYSRLTYRSAKRDLPLLRVFWNVFNFNHLSPQLCPAI